MSLLFYNSSDGPTGKPDLRPSEVKQYADRDVTLTCNNPTDAGNPNCDVYTWNKLEGTSENLPNTQEYTFTMDESRAGNYTCTCGNMYNKSEVSTIAEVILLATKPPPPSSSLCKYSL